MEKAAAYAISATIVGFALWICRPNLQCARFMDLRLLSSP
jgi:hypothetical protein